MTQRGRRPNPPNLVTLRGNPGKRARRKPLPFESNLPPAPRYLSEEERREWRKLGRKLVEQGLMCALYASTFELLVSSIVGHRTAKRMLEETGGLVIERPSSGALMRNPWAAERDFHAAQIVRLGGLFGMNPVDRPRVQPLDTAPTDDPFAEFDAGRS